MNPWMRNLLCGGGGGGGGAVLPPTGRTMLANLTSSLILDEGTGGPTWSRPTKAWGFNELGYLEELASGCAFFGGARLVRNLVPTPSNTLAVAGTKTVTLTQAATLQFSMGAGAGTATFSGTGGATGTLAAGASRVSVNKTVTAGTFIVTASVDALVDLSIVDVTNYPNSYVPEYVSVGSDTDKNFLLHTDDFSQAAWSKTNITVTQSAIANPVNGRIDAQKIEATVGAATQLIQTVTGAGSASGMALVLYVKKGSGATDMQTFALRNNTTATNVLGGRINYDTGVITYYAGSSGITAVDVGNGWWKLSLISATGFSAGDNITVYLGSNGSAETAGEFCYIYRPYLGRGTTVPANIPAVAGTWDPFGAGIDGAKYYTTDWQGAPIPAANLLGFRREAAATNNLLSCRDFTAQLRAAMDTQYWVANTTGTTKVTNGDFPSDTSGWTIIGAGSATVVGAKLRLDSTAAIVQANQVISGLTVGKMYQVQADITKVSGSAFLYTYIYTDSVGTTTCATRARNTTGAVSYCFVAVATDQAIRLANVTVGNVWDIDNVTITECTIKAETTATGLDGIANTATTLTATAADAIILQPITLASAARCASAYVKRRTGTGTISFTQDGGSTWTDITSQINSSTWSRVEITATLANPSVGFKISTSGDAIDVDCVQNEAGTKATSPIVTTTAAVTRNAESLTYQTAGNIDFAVGTIYCEVRSTPTGSNRNAVAPGNSSCNAAAFSTSWRAFDGTTVVEKTGLSDIGTGRRKRANSWGPANTKVTGDGLTPASGAFDGLFGDGAILYIAQNFQGYIGPVAIYNYQMTDAELQALTT